MEDKKVSDSSTIMTELVMPNHTNPLDKLMGGVLMKWMDTVAGICAGKHAESHVVTASVDNVAFQKSIPNGDVVTLEAKVTRVFNSSMEVFVEVFAAEMTGKNSRRSNHAYFTMVAVDKESLQPQKCGGVLPLTTEEQKMYDGALRRRQLRLILAGRMQPKDAFELKSIFE